MGEKSACPRGAIAACADVPSHAGHQYCIRSRRSIGSANDQDERLTTQPLQGCRNGFGRRAAGRLSREGGRMITVTIVSIVGMIRRGGPNGTLFLGPASRNQIAQTMLTMLTQ